VVSGVKEQKPKNTESKVLTQVIYVDGHKISLNFLSEENNDIGSEIRAILSDKPSDNTLEESKKI
jgi:hypothetical protein